MPKNLPFASVHTGVGELLIPVTDQQVIVWRFARRRPRGSSAYRREPYHPAAARASGRALDQPLDEVGMVSIVHTEARVVARRGVGSGSLIDRALPRCLPTGDR